jgi:hypothetical protein
MAKAQGDRTEQHQRRGEAVRPLPGEEARRGLLAKLSATGRRFPEFDITRESKLTRLSSHHWKPALAVLLAVRGICHSSTHQGGFNVYRTCKEGRLQREIATMRFRSATRRPVWAAAAIVLAVTLIGTAGSAHAATERRETVSGIATGSETRAMLHLPFEVQLMRGFDFRYVNGDHHIDAITVFPPDDTSLGISFRDKNGDDPMAYEASMTKVTLVGVLSPPPLREHCSGGTCTFPLQAPPNQDYIFVLRGFSLTFRPGCTFTVECDHHLSIVGIEPGDGNIAVTYQDKNGDDDYGVAIAYSYVPRSLVQGFGIANGTVDDAGTDHKNIDTSGTVAITGFRIGYVRVPIDNGPNTRLPDNHILRFGYNIPRDGGIDVTFGDNKPDTKWEYRLTFVRFK